MMDVINNIGIQLNGNAMNHFPQNLANYRRSKRMPSNQVCKALQLSRAALKAYESG